MKKIKVKSKKTKEMFEFLCMSSEYKDYFIYRMIQGEELCEFGHIRNFTPIGRTWEEIKNEKE